MDQETLKKLRELPAFRELREFLISELAEFDRLQNVPDIADPESFAVEVRARILASKFLSGILSQFADVPKGPPRVSNKEFVV